MGLFENSTFKFLMMCEIPVNVIQIEDFIKVGIDGVSIGSNDLTMLIMGTDRENAEVADTMKCLQAFFGPWSVWLKNAQKQK